MSTTRMLVLGVVRLFQPVHGYDVRRELVSWHVDEWASLATGSIYNALKSLTKEGLIAVVGTDQVGGRPERTTYELTARGEQELDELVRDCWWTVRMPIDPLVAAVSLLSFVDRKEAITAIEARAATIKGNMKHAEYAINAVDGLETPEHVREMLRLINVRMGAELAWGKAFAARLGAGEYNTRSDPRWHPAKPRGVSALGGERIVKRTTKTAKASETSKASAASKAVKRKKPSKGRSRRA
jgi:DNA-binding PadR family transcriptional regulator